MIPFLEVKPQPLKLKVKATVPFLSVRTQSIRVKVTPQFPAAVVGGAGVAVNIDNGIYKIALDVEKLQDVAPDGGAYLVVWDSVTRQFARIRITDLATLMGL